MLRHYLAVAIRHLHRRIGYSVINIMGLAISLTCCILLTLYIRHELSYDRFHQKADQIYRIAGNRFAATPAPWAPALVRDFPDVLQAVRIKPPFSRWHVRAGETRSSSAIRISSIFVRCSNVWFSRPRTFGLMPHSKIASMTETPCRSAIDSRIASYSAWNHGSSVSSGIY